MITPRTVRRYVKARIVTPRRVPMEAGGYRMAFTWDDVDKVLIARDAKRQRVKMQRPGLYRHMARKGV